MSFEQPGHVVENEESAGAFELIPCDLCGSHDSEVFIRQQDLLLSVTEEEFTLVRCRRCGMVYLNPRPSSGLLPRYYPSVYYPPARAKTGAGGRKAISARIKRGILEEYYGYPCAPLGTFARALRRIAVWPSKVLREFKGRYPLPWRGEGKVLDVGCGSGGNLKTLEDQGWQVSGIEISDVAAAHARSLVAGTIHTGTLESATFDPQRFDVILMNHSLEHFPSPVSALRRVHRLLKHDGLLVVSVPNAGGLEASLFGWWWFGWDLPRHFYHFDKHTISRALTKAGFRPVSYRTGTGSVFFMATLERFWTHRFHRSLPFRKIIDRLMVSPVTLIAGHLGYGTELTIHAVKQ